jgi:hypothetical protein
MRVPGQLHALTALHLRNSLRYSFTWQVDKDILDATLRRNLSAPAGNETPDIWPIQQPCHCPEYVDKLTSNVSGPEVYAGGGSGANALGGTEQGPAK